MNPPPSIFWEFNLPNPTTWFYFSLLLGIALFFKFTRLLSVRNWDVLTMYLPVPGLLLLLQPAAGGNSHLFAYVWLLGSSAYLLFRCLLDLALVRRPALAPNLNLAGLAWLGGTLFASLVAVSVRQPTDRPEQANRAPSSIKQVEQQGEKLVSQGAAGAELDSLQTHIAVERTLAILCHLSVVIGLVIVGCRHFQDAHAGVAAATFYLLLPYTFLLLPHAPLQCGQWHHILPMALVIWAVATYRMPLLAGMFLGLAAGSVYFPALLFPVWLSFYWRRGAGRFAAAFALAAGLSVASTALILWMDGHLVPSFRSALSLADWQAWKEPQTESLWSAVHWAYRLPVFIAYVAFVLTTALWPSPKNLGHVLALSAAVLIGIQFWYADRGGVYVLWYLPLLLLIVFRPNLSDRLPAAIHPEADWLYRLRNYLKSLSGRIVRLPSPPVRVR